MNRTTVLTLFGLSLLLTACGDATARIPSLDDATGNGADLGQTRHGVSFADRPC